ncbi:MAG: prepilin-type N-terminal cleavage/methylation domain-containing protein [Rhodoferax sp.]|nr:prepilin-type N-terminal cleavage/methylation domain-containing protein [Rhodoferax sp.]
MKNKCIHGFTIIEMAIVLLIVGLLLGGGLSVLGVQMEMQRVKGTERLLDEAREALIGFAVVNGRLPRPATSATNGVENPANCPTEVLCSGFIPWATLGTTRSDAWGKTLRYSVTRNFANPGLALGTPGTRNIDTRINGGPLVPVAIGVSAVVFSHGRRNFGTTEAGVAVPNLAATNADETSNDTGPLAYVQRTPSEQAVAPGEFDDIVIWIAPGILFNRMVQAGRLP